jgi:hypothetical protein
MSVSQPVSLSVSRLMTCHMRAAADPKAETADRCYTQATLCFLDDYNYISAINCDRGAEQERGLFQKR